MVTKAEALAELQRRGLAPQPKSEALPKKPVTVGEVLPKRQVTVGEAIEKADTFLDTMGSVLATVGTVTALFVGWQMLQSHLEKQDQQRASLKAKDDEIRRLSLEQHRQLLEQSPATPPSAIMLPQYAHPHEPEHEHERDDLGADSYDDDNDLYSLDD